MKTATIRVLAALTLCAAFSCQDNDARRRAYRERAPPELIAQALTKPLASDFENPAAVDPDLLEVLER